MSSLNTNFTKKFVNILRKWVWLAVVLILVIGEIPYIWQQLHALSFETIYIERSAPFGLSFTEPKLIVLVDPRQIDSIRSVLQLSDASVSIIRAVDFKTNFVIILVHGNFVASQSDIKRITRVGDVVTVYMDLYEIGLGSFGDGKIYTILRVPKTGKWGQTIKFILNVNQTGHLEGAFFIPDANSAFSPTLELLQETPPAYPVEPTVTPPTLRPPYP